MIFYLTRQYDQAVEQCRATLDMDPNYFRARMWLGRAFEEKGRYQEAIAEYQTARALDDSPYVLEWLARALAASELTSLAARVYVDSYYLASVYAALGQSQEAIRWLESAVTERSCWLSRLRVDPIFDRLRPEKGFERVLISLALR